MSVSVQRVQDKDQPLATAALTRAEARQIVNQLVRSHKDTIQSGRRCCWLTAEFYDRDGPAALTIDYPDAYLAKILGVSRQHLDRLKKAGRVLRLLSPMGDELPDLPERQLRPLTRLLDDPQKVRSAYETAQASVGDGERLTYQHVTAAVDNELPPKTERNKNKAQDTEPAKDTKPRPSQAPGRGGWVRDLWQAAAAWVDRLNEDRNTPPDLRAALEHVLELALKLAHEPEPDKDTNSLWTPNNKSSDLAHGGLGPVPPQKKSTGEQRAHTGTSLASSRADQVLPSRSQSRL